MRTAGLAECSGRLAQACRADDQVAVVSQPLFDQCIHVGIAEAAPPRAIDDDIRDRHDFAETVGKLGLERGLHVRINTARTSGQCQRQRGGEGGLQETAHACVSLFAARSARSSRRDTQRNSEGMKKVAITVEKIMPPITPVPME